MELNELKSNWQAAGQMGKSQQELQQMTRIQHHPRLQRIRLRLLIEATLLAAFLPLYYDAFDGNQKPLWTNLLLGTGMALFVCSNLLNYLQLMRPFRMTSLRKALPEFVSALNRLAVFSVTCTLFLGASLILFFSLNTNFTPQKWLLFSGIVTTTLIAAFISYRNWRYRIRHIQQAIDELEEN